MKHFTLVLLCLFPLLLPAQLWTEDFDGSNTTNPPTLAAECYESTRDYIGFVCEDNSGCTNEKNADYVLNNQDGIYFGVRDMDAGTCSGDLAGEDLIFSGIDISSCGGASVLYVCFTVAESRNMGDAMGAEWGSSNGREDTWDGNSSVMLSASVDGAAATAVTAIEAFDNSDTRPGIDVNCDGKANDAGEPEITDTFTGYCFELPSFGSTVDLTFTVAGLNTGGEDIQIDDIQVFCETDPSSLPGTLLAACTPFDGSGGGPGVTFWEEDFDGGNATNPFAIDANCSIADSRDYFGVVCLDGAGCDDEINAIFNYNNTDGSFFGARDIDGPCGGTPFGSLTASGIDISGCSDQVYLCLDLAESNSAAENSSSGDFDSWDGNSSLYIYTTFNDGTELALAGLQSSDGSNSIPAWDLDCNTGGGNGPTITEDFTTYCFALDMGNYTSVDITIEINGLNTGGEDIALDNISLSCTNNTGDLPGTVLSSCNISRQQLPVTLASFTGETLPKGDNLLRWETSTEVGNDYFEVEHSNDGYRFSPLGRVAGQGTSTITNQYSYEHASPAGGVNYYRLKQVDFGGAITYSEVITLHSGTAKQRGVIFPNPVRNSLTYQGTAGELIVRNSLGQVVLRQAAVSSATIIDLNGLEAGAYFLETVFDDDSRELQRFIKQ